MDINKSKAVRYPKFGNALAASSDLSAGDLIIRINEPYLILAENAALNRVCSHCLYEKSPLKRCAGCRTAQYCSTRCQSLSWKSVHKLECPILKRSASTPPTPVRGLVNLFLRKAIGAVPDPRWVGLEGHADGLKKQGRWNEIVLEANAAVGLSGSSLGCVESAIHLLCRMATNAFRVTLADNSPVGLCFEPVISLANHSCTPNATIMFDGRRIEVRALDAIKKDEQIFISYIDPTQPRDTRRGELSTRYFFTCECETCVQNDSPYATFLKAVVEPYPKLDLFIEPKTLVDFATARVQDPPLLTSNAVSGNHANATIASLSRQISALPSNTPAIQPNPTLLHDLYLAHLDAGNYVPAVIFLLHLYHNCDAYQYPQPHHPVRVVRLYTISRLLKQIASLPVPKDLQSGLPAFSSSQILPHLQNLDLISSIQVLLTLTHDLGTRSHGSSSAFIMEVAGELAEVEDVQRQRGGVGQRLREWGVDGDGDGNGEGGKYARKILEGLAGLGECGGLIISSD